MRSQSSHRHAEKAAEKSTQTVSRLQQAATDTATSSSSPAQPMSSDRAESELGVSVPNKQTLFGLQRKKATHPRRFSGWVDEGMTSETMGDPNAIEAFRQRQADRPPEVPTDIERRNKRSVQRSTDAAAETGPAGQTGVPDSVRDVISSTGHSLDGTVQRMMEDRMDSSFDDVQVHTGAKAANACESINARAFTVGNHVAFNQGEYEPDSPEGQHVIAHELAHVRQQTEGAVSMLPQESPELEVDPDPALEREAEQTAQRVMQGGELGIQRIDSTDVHIQRMSPDQRDQPQGVKIDQTAPVTQQMGRLDDEKLEDVQEILGGVVDLSENAGDGVYGNDCQPFGPAIGLYGAYQNIKEVKHSCSLPETTAEDIINRRRERCWHTSCGTMDAAGSASSLCFPGSNLVSTANNMQACSQIMLSGSKLAEKYGLMDLTKPREFTNQTIDSCMSSIFGSPESIVEARSAVDTESLQTTNPVNESEGVGHSDNRPLSNPHRRRTHYQQMLNLSSQIRRHFTSPKPELPSSTGHQE